MRAKMQMRDGVGAGEEGAADFASRGIAMRVENARTAVSCLASKGKLGARAIEFSAPFDQLRDVLWTFFDEECNGFRATEAVTGVQRVLLVKTDFIFVAECYGDAALCPGSGGIAEIGFCEDKNGTCGTQFDGSAQPSDAGTYHGVVRVIGVWSGSHRMLRAAQVW